MSAGWFVFLTVLALIIVAVQGLTITSLIFVGMAGLGVAGFWRVAFEKRKFQDFVIPAGGDGRLVFSGTRDEIESLLHTPVEPLEPFILACSPALVRAIPALSIVVLLVAAVLAYVLPFRISCVVYMYIACGVSILVTKIFSTVYYRVRPGFVDAMRPRSPWSSVTIVESSHRTDRARIDTSVASVFIYPEGDAPEKELKLAGGRQRLELIRHLLVGAVLGPNDAHIPDDSLLG